VEQSLPESIELFPKRMTVFALILSIGLITGITALVFRMNRSFNDLHHHQFPIVERASINIRLLNLIDQQIQQVVTARNTQLWSELRLNLDSLEGNLRHFQESLHQDRQYSELAKSLKFEPVLKAYAEVISLLKEDQLENAIRLVSSSHFQEQSSHFVSGIADLTEELSLRRDQELDGQLRLIKIAIVSFFALSIFIGILFGRIYQSYHVNLNRRVEAEKQVVALSHQRKQFIHVLCHDLGNPVASIYGLIDYVEKREGESRKKVIDLMRQSASSAQAIIDSVRKLQALDSGKLQLEVSPHRLVDLIQESVTVLDERIRQKNLQIELAVKSELQVQVDRTSFVGSVLNNILTNAIKFSPKGSPIEIRADQKGELIELQLRDHGVGMPAAIRENVFNELATTSRPGTDGEPGTGFGMSLVKKFVLAYGGRISIDSSENSENHGTSIKIELQAA
jgi:signal transduction histidine kinase